MGPDQAPRDPSAGSLCPGAPRQHPLGQSPPQKLSSPTLPDWTPSLRGSPYPGPPWESLIKGLARPSGTH